MQGAQNSAELPTSARVVFVVGVFFCVVIFLLDVFSFFLFLFLCLSWMVAGSNSNRSRQQQEQLVVMGVGVVIVVIDDCYVLRSLTPGE